MSLNYAKHHHYLNPEHFHYPPKKLCVQYWSLSFFFPPAPGNHYPWSLSIYLFIYSTNIYGVLLIHHTIF